MRKAPPGSCTVEIHSRRVVPPSLPPRLRGHTRAGSRFRQEETAMGETFVGAKEAIAQTAEGRMVVVTDAEDRENEGDLVVGAQFATAEVVNFMARHGRGLICLALDEARCDQLE